MKFLDQPPRYLFFTGKGGVGKTSIACAVAFNLAEAGRRVLIVSTDPASNVGQVFGITIGNRITPIHAVNGLTDPAAAVGDRAAQHKAFANAQFQIASRIRLFLSLPIDKVDRISLQSRIRELGAKGRI